MQNKQRLELADYEAENLARLQKNLASRWEFIFLQAEAQAKVDKKRDKLERKVLDSQERAFWNTHRPAPGCVNMIEVDIKKTSQNGKSMKAIRQVSAPGGVLTPTILENDNKSMDSIKQEVQRLKASLDRRRVKVSKVADSFISFFEQYSEFDPFIAAPEPSNPWLTESTDFWDQDFNMREIPQRRVRRWGFSIHELLRDPAGREQFETFLKKEFSAENLHFLEACQKLRFVPEKDVADTVKLIFDNCVSRQSQTPVNIDCRVYDSVKEKVENSPDRYCFEEAVEHVYQLLKRDSYCRYLRSEMYKEYLGTTKKKVPIHFAFSFATSKIKGEC